MSKTIIPDKVDFLTVSCAHLRVRESALVCQNLSAQIERLKADLAREASILDERRAAYDAEWRAISEKYNLSESAHCVLDGKDAGKIIDPTPEAVKESSEGDGGEAGTP